MEDRTDDAVGMLHDVQGRNILQLKSLDHCAGLAKDQLDLYFYRNVFISPTSCSVGWKNGTTLFLQVESSKEISVNDPVAFVLHIDQGMEPGYAGIYDESVRFIGWNDSIKLLVRCVELSSASPQLENVGFKVTKCGSENGYKAFNEIEVEKMVSRKVRGMTFRPHSLYLIKFLEQPFVLRSKSGQNHIGKISRNTKVSVDAQSTRSTIALDHAPPIGLEGLVTDLKLIIESLMKGTIRHRSIAPRSALIIGPHGRGKTAVLQYLKSWCNYFSENHCDRKFDSILLDCARLLLNADAGKDLSSKVLGLTSVGRSSVVFIDHLDVLAVSSALPAASTVESWVSGLLKGSGDPSTQLLVICACSEESFPDVSKNLMQSNSNTGFQMRVFLESLSSQERSKILKEELTKHCLVNTALDPTYCVYETLAELSGGFTPADLTRFVQSARLEQKMRSIHDPAVSCLSVSELVSIMMSTTPLQVDSVHSVSVSGNTSASLVNQSGWDSRIGGFDSVKSRMEQILHWNSLHPDRAISGVLLHGPSGCGKTLLATSLARLGKFRFISVKVNELVSMYFGESERRIRKLFQQAHRSAPCILFFDEIDSLAIKRSHQFGIGLDNIRSSDGTANRMLTTLLNEMDGISGSRGVFFLGATNRMESIDAALLRPGRLGTLIEIGLPNYNDRLEILKLQTADMPLSADVDLQILAKSAKGKTCADIAALCTEAGISVLREKLKESPNLEGSRMIVERRHFMM